MKAMNPSLIRRGAMILIPVVVSGGGSRRCLHAAGMRGGMVWGKLCDSLLNWQEWSAFIVGGKSLPAWKSEGDSGGEEAFSWRWFKRRMSFFTALGCMPFLFKCWKTNYLITWWRIEMTCPGWTSCRHLLAY